MVDQVMALEDDHPAGPLAFNMDEVKRGGHLKAGYSAIQVPTHGPTHSPREEVLKERRPHDFLAFDRGVTRFATAMWWILGMHKHLLTDPIMIILTAISQEIIPLFTRLELEHGEWIPRYWPPNLGVARDLPPDARLHKSVLQMHKAGVIRDMPRLGGDPPPSFQDPVMLMQSWGCKLLPWNWSWKKNAQKTGPTATQNKMKKVTNVVNSHGAQVWCWGY